MNVKTNNLYAIVGKSGSGKTTLADRLSEEYGLPVLKSYTTRPKRHEGDTDHTFINEAEYDALPDKVCTTTFNGNRYCATKDQLDTAALYVIDPRGLKELKENYNGKPVVVIYINASMELCLERMLERGDSVDAAWDRLKNDYTEFKDAASMADIKLEARDSKDSMLNVAYYYICIKEGWSVD